MSGTGTRVGRVRTALRVDGPAPWIGLAVVAVLVVLAFTLPSLLDWDVASRAPRSARRYEVPPLHGYWKPGTGAGTVPAILLAVLGVLFGARVAERLGWRRLLALSYLVGLLWLLALVTIDGTDGISRVLGNRFEYLQTAREVDDVGALLREFLSRVPYSADDNWVTHVAGHPPLMLLIFVGMVRLGIGTDFGAGLTVTFLAALLPLAVLGTMRALGAEGAARRAAPFLVLSPAAVFLSVSADALIALVGAFGIACLALGATRASRVAAVAWSLLAGLLLGAAVLMSYGMLLSAVLAVAVLVAARSWLPLPVAAMGAGGVVLGFAGAGFALWEALPVIRERYYDGIAKDRPYAYWVWANLALLAVSAGPAIGAGVARLITRVRSADRVVLLLAGAGLAMVLLADLSGMSKAEVERIWLPFIPWITVSLAVLSPGWRRGALALQVTSALVVQHLFYTVW